FQAEDGIRDLIVTGVQTCALPICCRPGMHPRRRDHEARRAELAGRPRHRTRFQLLLRSRPMALPRALCALAALPALLLACSPAEIGRASCRERAWHSVGDGACKGE